ncbi:MAG TPA: TOBE domain-containing protein, partial [Candidatus Dormibacteraeota bacterium]|nr:TOBE domain-containing protein [Candidatus Dormibacteraeota bacterium]
ATEFVAGFIGISNLLTRDGVRFVVRPEKLHMLLEGDSPGPGMTVEPGVVEQVVYVGQSTRFNIRLDQGEQLVAVRQNSETADDAQGMESRRIRLAWAPEHTYVLDRQQPPDQKPAAVEIVKER